MLTIGRQFAHRSVKKSWQAKRFMHELAQIVDRDFAAVLRDCMGLSTTGFIHLKDTKDKKGTKVPQLRFNYSGLIVYLPENPYQIEFQVAV